MERAFAAFFNEHEHKLRAFALRRTASPAWADEIVAGVMVIAWRRFNDIPPEAPFGWLCGVAFRVARNDERGRRRYVRLIDQAVAEAETRPLVAYLESDALLAEQLEAVVAAFQVLGDLDQEVLRLVAWEGLNGRDLAAALDTSEPAARKRVSRARERLRAAYLAVTTDSVDEGRAR